MYLVLQYNVWGKLHFKLFFLSSLSSDLAASLRQYVHYEHILYILRSVADIRQQKIPGE